MTPTDPASAAPDLATPRPAEFTRNERRRIRRRTVGWLDDGRKAFPVHKGDTEAMARAIFDGYDEELVMDERIVVDWCPHTSDYQYRNGCDDWCDRPTSRFVWTARYPARVALEGSKP